MFIIDPAFFSSLDSVADIRKSTESNDTQIRRVVELIRNNSPDNGIDILSQVLEDLGMFIFPKCRPIIQLPILRKLLVFSKFECPCEFIPPLSTRRR